MLYEDFEEKLGSWGPALKPFIESEKCDEIYSFLHRRSKERRKIVPLSSDTFKAYELCDIKKVKCVIVGFDPYPQLYNKIPIADGIAFSSSNVDKVPDSLRCMIDGIFDDMKYVKYEEMYEDSKNLSYLSQQGVLLTNYSLTTEINKIGIHSDKKLWEEFHKFTIEEILNKKDGMVYILMGSYAQRLEKYIIPFNSYVFKIPHPSYAVRSGIKWEHQNVFSKANKLLEENKKEKINWTNCLF